MIARAITQIHTSEESPRIMRDGEGGVHDYSAPRSLDRMDAPRSGANGEQ